MVDINKPTGGLDAFNSDCGGCDALLLFRMAEIRAEIAKICGGPVREMDPGYVYSYLKDHSAYFLARNAVSPVRLSEFPDRDPEDLTF